MSRDDSSLYTGINSASYAKSKERKAEKSSAKKDSAVAVKKDAKVVFELLDKELKSIPSKYKELTIDHTAETWKSTGIALNMYEQLCLGLKRDLELILKAAK